MYMAVYRQIQTSFWQDDFVLNLTPEEKYFYLYLLTNSKTKQCGIYQLPMPIIIIETGYNQETVDKLLRRFIEYGKILYNAKIHEIGIVNWLKYNRMESPKIKACVNKELKEVKDKTLIDKIYLIQGVSQKEQEEEEEKEKEKTTTEEPASGSSSSHYHEDGNLNQSIMLFTRIWNKLSSTPEEQRLVTGYLTSYGFLEVEFGFRQALKHNNRKLVYVEGICKKRKEKLAIEKSKEEARQKKLEQDKLLTSQREAWKKLNLVEMTFGKNPENPPHKEIESG